MIAGSHGMSVENMLSRLPSLLRNIAGTDDVIFLHLLLLVSESYSAACEEMKLFFPDGLCCNETAELKAERIPTPGVDRIICKGT